jgi:hypothetical protein
MREPPVAVVQAQASATSAAASVGPGGDVEVTPPRLDATVLSAVVDVSGCLRDAGIARQFNCSAVAVSPCGRYVACGAADGVVAVVDCRAVELPVPESPSLAIVGMPVALSSALAAAAAPAAPGKAGRKSVAGKASDGGKASASKSSVATAHAGAGTGVATGAGGGTAAAPADLSPVVRVQWMCNSSQLLTVTANGSVSLWSLCMPGRSTDTVGAPPSGSTTTAEPVRTNAFASWSGVDARARVKHVSPTLTPLSAPCDAPSMRRHTRVPRASGPVARCSVASPSS